MSKNDGRPLKGAAADTPKDNPFVRVHHERAAAAARRVGPPLTETIVKRMEVAVEQLPAIKTPGATRSHARAGAVYVYLAFNASSETGMVKRSVARIAADVGCQPRQADNCLTLLLELGLLTRRPDSRSKGRWPTSVYTLRQPMTDGNELPTATEGSTVGNSRSSPSAIQGATVGNGLPTNQEDNQEPPSGPSNRDARERAGEGDCGEVAPAAQGEANSENGNGTEQDASGESTGRNPLPTANGRSAASVLPDMLAIIGEEPQVLAHLLHSRDLHPELADDDEFAKAIFRIVCEGPIGLTSIPDARLRRCIGDYLGRVIK